MLDLYSRLGTLNKSYETQDIQSMVFSVGKDHNFENLKEWFSAVYEILLGTKTGPRLGGFISIYGIQETRKLIYQRLDV